MTSDLWEYNESLIKAVKKWRKRNPEQRKHTITQNIETAIDELNDPPVAGLVAYFEVFN